MRNLTRSKLLFSAVVATLAIACEPSRAVDRTETDPLPGGLVGDGYRYVSFQGSDGSPVVLDSKTETMRKINRAKGCVPVSVSGGRVLLDCSFDVETQYNAPRIATARGGSARRLPGSGKYSRPLKIGKFWALVEQDCPLRDPGCPTNGQTIQRNIRLTTGKSILVPLSMRMKHPGYFPKISVQNLNSPRRGLKDQFPRFLPRHVNRWTAITYTGNAAITIEPSRRRPNDYLDSDLVLWRTGGAHEPIAKAINAFDVQLGSGRLTWISSKWLTQDTKSRVDYLHSLVFDRSQVSRGATLPLPGCSADKPPCSSATPVRRGAITRVPDERSNLKFVVSIHTLPRFS